MDMSIFKKVPIVKIAINETLKTIEEVDNEIIGYLDNKLKQSYSCDVLIFSISTEKNVEGDFSLTFADAPLIKDEQREYIRSCVQDFIESYKNNPVIIRSNYQKFIKEVENNPLLSLLSSTIQESENDDPKAVNERFDEHIKKLVKDALLKSTSYSKLKEVDDYLKQHWEQSGIELRESISNHLPRCYYILSFKNLPVAWLDAATFNATLARTLVDRFAAVDTKLCEHLYIVTMNRLLNSIGADEEAEDFNQYSADESLEDIYNNHYLFQVEDLIRDVKSEGFEFANNPNWQESIHFFFKRLLDVNHETVKTLIKSTLLSNTYKIKFQINEQQHG